MAVNSPQHFISTLSSFHNLNELVIPELSTLNVGYDPSKCKAGNDEFEVAYRKEMAFLGRRLPAEVTKLTFDACRSLDCLWIGKRCRVEVVRDGSGLVLDENQMTWYTGRRPSPKHY
jgi:hypothetical protein